MEFDPNLEKLKAVFPKKRAEQILSIGNLIKSGADDQYIVGFIAAFTTMNSLLRAIGSLQEALNKKNRDLLEGMVDHSFELGHLTAQAYKRNKDAESLN